MNESGAVTFDKQIYYRLVALWVISEALVGGLIHGLKLPFSGLIVGSTAVLCICLIGYYAPAKWAILKATIIVAIFKMLLSPQTPPTAFIAVFFQGLTGQVLFYNHRHFKISCILLGIIALAESALQRIIVFTLIYGTNFWKAINEFIRKVTGEQNITNYSMIIAGGYVILHAIIGFAVGLGSAAIIKRSVQWKPAFLEYIIEGVDEPLPEVEEKRSRKKRLKIFFFIIWIALIGLFIQSRFQIGEPLLPENIVIQILIRSVLILLTWYFLLKPLLIHWMQKWLTQQRTRLTADIGRIVSILPFTRYIFIKSWEMSGRQKGLKRIFFFFKILLINTLHNTDITLASKT